MSAIRTTGRTPAAQAFRANQVIETARQLASEGGYEAVQMREVAKRARVALATLYRYYPSKDDLIRAFVDTDVQLLRDDVIARPPRNSTPDARAATVFIRAFRAMTRDRGFAQAAMSIHHSPRPLGLGRGPVAEPLRNSFVDIAALAAWGPDHETTADEYLALHVLESLLNSSVLSWLDGAMTAEYVEERLAFAGTRMLTSETPAQHADVKTGTRRVR
ncbi:TetR family transcriptional regulator (plasmid) [Embleya sp. NBC_00888]|uniref:TetR family transcriptional regulator n=1 Tax=Embleya sp. NBC_00888 TaxID=2975960 RepID=UPI002F90FAA6|nr:TetR family transcriptional regulator [Embleya sp. NBC_00888]